MIYVEAPIRIINHLDIPNLFVAGGITGTSNWQKNFISMISDCKIAVYNPRRENFDINDKNAQREQIEWEYTFLKEADIISFWFPPETICPITLFELGTVIQKNNTQKVFVGCHPEYKRIDDVKIQVEFRNPTIRVVESLSVLAEQIKQWLP